MAYTDIYQDIEAIRTKLAGGLAKRKLGQQAAAQAATIRKLKAQQQLALIQQRMSPETIQQQMKYQQAMLQPQYRSAEEERLAYLQNAKAKTKQYISKVRASPVQDVKSFNDIRVAQQDIDEMEKEIQSYEAKGFSVEQTPEGLTFTKEELIEVPVETTTAVPTTTPVTEPTPVPSGPTQAQYDQLQKMIDIRNNAAKSGADPGTISGLDMAIDRASQKFGIEVSKPSTPEPQVIEHYVTQQPAAPVAPIPPAPVVPTELPSIKMNETVWNYANRLGTRISYDDAAKIIDDQIKQSWDTDLITMRSPYRWKQLKDAGYIPIQTSSGLTFVSPYLNWDKALEDEWQTYLKKSPYEKGLGMLGRFQFSLPKTKSDYEKDIFYPNYIAGLGVSKEGLPLTVIKKSLENPIVQVELAYAGGVGFGALAKTAPTVARIAGAGMTGYWGGSTAGEAGRMIQTGDYSQAGPLAISTIAQVGAGGLGFKTGYQMTPKVSILPSSSKVFGTVSTLTSAVRTKIIKPYEITTKFKPVGEQISIGQRIPSYTPYGKLQQVIKPYKIVEPGTWKFDAKAGKISYTMPKTTPTLPYELSKVAQTKVVPKAYDITKQWYQRRTGELVPAKESTLIPGASRTQGFFLSTEGEPQIRIKGGKVKTTSLYRPTRKTVYIPKEEAAFMRAALRKGGIKRTKITYEPYIKEGQRYTFYPGEYVARAGSKVKSLEISKVKVPQRPYKIAKFKEFLWSTESGVGLRGGAKLESGEPILKKPPKFVYKRESAFEMREGPVTSAFGGLRTELEQPKFAFEPQVKYQPKIRVPFEPSIKTQWVSTMFAPPATISLTKQRLNIPTIGQVGKVGQTQFRIPKTELIRIPSQIQLPREMTIRKPKEIEVPDYMRITTQERIPIQKQRIGQMQRQAQQLRLQYQTIRVPKQFVPKTPKISIPKEEPTFKIKKGKKKEGRPSFLGYHERHYMIESPLYNPYKFEPPTQKRRKK